MADFQSLHTIKYERHNPVSESNQRHYLKYKFMSGTLVVTW